MFPLRDTQPSYTKPVVTMILIAINVFVFLFELSLDDWTRNAFVATYGLVPEHFAVSSLITSTFLHGGWMHLLGNMWFLWIFGDNIEDILGHGKYVLFYLACGAVAGLTQSVLTTDPRVPMVGASGAIAGVMGAYMVKFPHSRIVTLIPILLFFTIDIPAWIMLIYWFVTQFFSGVGSITYSHVSEGGGVAFFAHVGGFVMGAILISVMGTQQRYTRRRDLYW
jgi:membrane associated rhomboid family serine protease